MSIYKNAFFLLRVVCVVCALVATLVAAPAFAGGGDGDNVCEGTEEPDVIVGSLHQEVRWGEVGTKTAFSIGTYSCNIGSCGLNWISSNNNHPVIPQNMYRIKDGRFEQLGQSWLKHGFFALSNELCNTGCLGTDGSQLGVNCADPYTASRNGQQNNLGPRFEVNASTGVYNYPFSNPGGVNGNTIFKRIQVENSELNPTLNPGAIYVVEAQYVTKDDATAGNQDNNASWRQISTQDLGGANNSVDINLLGITHMMEPAIFAWKFFDPSVELTMVDVGPTDGVFWVGAKVTDNGNGTWHYEYAIHNLNSDRSARAFHVPVVASAVIQNLGFRDVPYHSGEPQNGTDWNRIVDASTVPGRVLWDTQTFAQNANANAIRWGTTYNFRFDSELPPKQGQATLELFKPGTPSSVVVNTLVPTLCNANGSCDVGEPTCECVVDCTPPPLEFACADAVDDDCDGSVDCFDVDCCVAEGGACAGVDQDADSVGICSDCNDQNNTIWATPSEAQDEIWQIVNGVPTLLWQAPAAPGSNVVLYEVLRSSSSTDFSNPTCLTPFNPTQKRVADPTVPPVGGGFSYLVRGTNTCGDGDVGTWSDGTPRVAGVCP